MTRANIVSMDRKKSFYCTCCQRVEDTKKRHYLAIVSLCNDFTLQWLKFATLHFYGCVLFKKAVYKYLIKANSFLTTDCTGKN